MPNLYHWEYHLFTAIEEVRMHLIEILKEVMKIGDQKKTFFYFMESFKSLN